MSNKTNIYRFRETAGADRQGELIADGAITPGQYVYEVGGKIKRWATASSKAPSALFANDRTFQGDTGVAIDADYTTAETAFYSQYLAGDVVNCHIANGETVSVDSYLTPDAVGNFTVATAIVAASLATGVIVDNNAITFTAVDSGSFGNTIEVVLIDPSANSQSLVVSVEGLLVKVSLKTGAGGAIESTATEIIAAVTADDAANILVSVDDTGASTGAGVVVAEAAATLAGGADADAYVLKANEAVTTSGSTDRCEATVL
jgi:hypothetical protein